jgi:hypothetical protein
MIEINKQTTTKVKYPYFIKRNGEWFLLSDGVERKVTEKDCDIELLDCGCDGDTVYGSAVFG